MSTRSELLIYSKIVERDWEAGPGAPPKEELWPTARMYRHHDGYPEGHGFDICRALAMADMEDDLDNRSWEQHFLKRYLAMELTVNFEPPAGERQFCHGDLEYVYRLTGTQDYTGGREGADGFMASNVLLEVFKVWDVDPGKDYSALDSKEPLFAGSWREYPKWLRSHCGGKCVTDSEYGADKWYCQGASRDCWNNLAMLSR